MKYNLLFLVSIICLTSCNTSIQEKKEIVKEETRFEEDKPIQNRVEETQDDTLEKRQMECEAYWKNISLLNSLKDQYIDEILSENKLSTNNQKFLTALKNEKKGELAFKQPLSAIFRLSNAEIGITVSPEYKQVDKEIIWISKEDDLLKKYDTTKSVKSTLAGARFYPTVLTSLFSGKPKPTINYYTTKRIGSTQLVDLGVYGDECSDYFQYSLDTTNISINDKLLFSSPFVIDLVFENNPTVDALLQNSYKEECMDCPSSGKLEKSFAKVKSADNLYFVYADTFPVNNKLDTPSRGLVLITEKKEIIYVWYEEIDLFGCACL